MKTRFIIAVPLFLSGWFLLIVAEHFADRAHAAPATSIIEQINGAVAVVFIGAAILGIVGGIGVAIFGMPRPL